MITDRLPKTDCTIFLMQLRGHAALLRTASTGTSLWMKESYNAGLARK